MLATTYVHTKFPFRAPDNKALLRCFLGGAGDPGVLKLSDEEITALVRKELKQIIGLSADPWFVKVYRWIARWRNTRRGIWSASNASAHP